MGLSSVRQVRGKGRGKGKKDGDVRSLLHNSLAIITRPHSVEIPASNSYPIIHVTLHWNIQKVFLTQPESILTIVLTELEVYVPNSMSNVTYVLIGITIGQHTGLSISKQGSLHSTPVSFISG